MTTPDVELNGLVVVITGAAQGLGRAYAVAIAAAGGRLVVNDVNSEAVEETAAIVRAGGGEAVVHIGAVQDPETGPALVDLAQSKFGGLGSAILNAGVMDVTPAAACTPAELRKVVDINVLGTMLCGVPVLRTMKEQGHGSLVLIVSGARFGMTGITAYGATKGAVASLVWGWAAETAQCGVRVNALSPFAHTAMFASNPAVVDGPTPESIAPAAVFMVSDENSLSGEIVRFDSESLAIYREQGSAMTNAITRSRWSSGAVAAAVAELSAGHTT